MNLYCPECNELERFTVGEVERIVYALGAAEADARAQPAEKGEQDALCHRAVLEQYASEAHELYGEYVDALVSNRRYLTRGEA